MQKSAESNIGERKGTLGNMLMLYVENLTK